MWGRNHNPVDQAGETLHGVLGDIKGGALKGAALGSLNALGSKAAEAAHNADESRKARKARKDVSHAVEMAANAKKQKDAVNNVAATVANAKKGAKNTVSNLNLNLTVDDIPRLVRGGTLLANGLGTLFAPGSPLDASKSQSVDTKAFTDQTRKGIDTATDMTQQRIKDLVDLSKDTLSSLSDVLTGSIETAESRMHKALDETEKSLSQTTGKAAKRAKSALPNAKKNGGAGRWLFLGLLVGGTVAFLSSPLSGPLGERVRNLQRDLGLGGDSEDDSQYWPSPPQGANGATETVTNPVDASGADASGADAKTETWNKPTDPKDDPGKA